MSATYEEAVDQMLGILVAVWDPSIPIFYENSDKEKPSGTQDEKYLRAFVRHVMNPNRTLSGGVGSTLYERSGTLTFHVHTPIGKGLQLSYALCKVLTDAYESKTTSGGVWFRNARVKEVGRTDNSFQSNVLIDFNYHELK